MSPPGLNFNHEWFLSVSTTHLTENKKEQNKTRNTSTLLTSKSTLKSQQWGRKTSQKRRPRTSEKPTAQKEEKLSTFDAVVAMSDSDEGSVDENNKAWNAKAAVLQKLIEDGAYDKIMDQDKECSGDDESIEEVVLGDENESDGGEKERSGHKRTEQKGKKISQKTDPKKPSDDAGSDDDDQESEKDDDSEEEGEQDDSKQPIFDLNSKALLTKTEELLLEKKGLPWVEKFEVIPSVRLPFGIVDEETGMKIDVHDDLKREVAFYDIAMDAVKTAKTKCKENGIPFSRPDDFFAGWFCNFAVFPLTFCQVLNPFSFSASQKW